MTIYIDKECKCHVENGANRRRFEVSFFDGRPDSVVEGYCFVPSGESYDGHDGETAYPWKSYDILDAYREEHERMRAKLQTEYQRGVNSV